MTDTEWAELAIELAGRWPRWAPSEVEKADWKAELQKLNPTWLREASQRVRRKYSSDVPQLKWVLEMFGDVAKENAASVPRDHKPSNAEQYLSQRLDELGRLDSVTLANVHEYVGLQYPPSEGNQSASPYDWEPELVAQAHFFLMRAGALHPWPGVSESQGGLYRGIAEKGMKAVGA